MSTVATRWSAAAAAAVVVSGLIAPSAAQAAEADVQAAYTATFDNATGFTPKTLTGVQPGDTLTVTFNGTGNLYYNVLNASHPQASVFSIGGKDCGPSTPCPVSNATVTLNIVRPGEIVAFSSAGAGSYKSMVAEPPKTGPTAVTATAGARSAVISWQAPPDYGWPVTGYAVTSLPTGHSCTTTGALSCTVSGLTPGDTYSFVVYANNVFGTTIGTQSNSVTALAAVPSAPMDVLAAPGDASAVVSWLRPLDDGGSPITGYRVEAVVGTTPSGRSCTTTGAYTCTVTGLTNGTTYGFFVYAINAIGSSPLGLSINTVTPIGEPDPPAGVMAAPGDRQVTMSWTSVATTARPVTSYTARLIDIITMKEFTCTATAPATSCTVTGLQNGVLYGTEVEAVNAVGTSNPSPGPNVQPVGTLPQPVLTPTWDAAQAVFTLTWSPYDWAGYQPKEFVIEWKERSAQSWITVRNPSPTAESFTFPVNTLNLGDTYNFKVTAKSAGDTLSQAGLLTYTVPNPGITITDVTPGDGSVVVSWKDYRHLGSYNVVVIQAGQRFSFNKSCSDCSQRIAGLTNGVAAYVYVEAVGDKGALLASSARQNFTPTAPAPAPLPVPVVKKPVISGTTATLDWAPYNWGTYTPDRFEIAWTNNSGTNWNYIDITGPQPGTTTTITGLTPGSTTRFEVRAVPTAGTGNESGWGFVEAVIPAAPLSLTISAAALDSAINVSWQPVKGAATYDVGWYVPPNGVTEHIPGVTCTTGPCTTTIPNLKNGTAYTVILNAYKSDNKLLVGSNYVTVTPVAPAAPLDVVYPVSVDLQVGLSVVIDPDAKYSSGSPNNFIEGSTKLPSGLTLDKTTGEITGTPLTTADGLYPIVVSNAQGQRLTVPIRLRVTSHTLTLSYPDVSGHVGTPLSLVPTVSNAIGALSPFRLVSGALPAGLTFDSVTGAISGTPTAATTGPVILAVSVDDLYGKGTSTFSITVDSGNATLQIAYANAVAHVGKPITVTPTVSGATGPTTFALTSGTLPAGLTLDPATGVISGVPTTAQPPTPVTVQVTSGSATDDVTFSISVLAHTLSLAYPSSTRDIGVPAQLSPVISHVEGTVTYKLTSGTLPAGLTLDPTTGKITGTPTAVTSGPIALEITATDAYASATAAFTLQVTDPTPAVPVVTGTLTRDVERLNVIGSVANARPGDVVTPMFKLTGESTFTAGVPVILDANNAFTWTRLVSITKSAQVYFMVQSSSSPILRAERPAVTTTGSRTATTVTVIGAARNIRAGSVVHPWIKVNGGRAIKGTPLAVGTDGSFTWTYAAAKGDSVRVKFNVRGIKSDPIVL